MRVKVKYTNLKTSVFNAETGDMIFTISSNIKKGCTAAEFDKSGEAIDDAITNFFRARPDLEIVEKIHPNQGIREFPDSTYQDL